MELPGKAAPWRKEEDHETRGVHAACDNRFSIAGILCLGSGNVWSTPD
jgi:hypothetical protein